MCNILWSYIMNDTEEKAKKKEREREAKPTLFPLLLNIDDDFEGVGFFFPFLVCGCEKIKWEIISALHTKKNKENERERERGRKIIISMKYKLKICSILFVL